MTDLSPSPNYNPSVRGGKVTYNGVIDQRKIKNYQQNIRKCFFNRGKFTPSSRDEVYEIKQRGLTFARKVDPPVNVKNYNLEVFQALNGMFDSSYTPEKIESETYCVGIAASAVPFNSKSGNNVCDVALIVGGNDTIINTGNKNIRNGDWLLTIVPTDLEDPCKPGTDRGVVVFWVVPYDEAIFKLNARRLMDIAKDSSKLFFKDPNYASTTRSSGQDDTIKASAKEMLAGFMQLVLPVLHGLCLSGVVVIDRDAFESSKRREENSNAYTQHIKVSKGNKDLRTIASSLGLLGKDKIEDTMITSIASVKTGKSTQHTLLDTLLNTLIPGKAHSNTFYVEEDHINMYGAIPGGNDGELNRLQIGAIERILIALEYSQNHYKQRIFAKALAPAKPGEELDILCGNYSM